MKAIMISDHANWCALMMNGKKKVEVRSGTVLYKATQKLIDEYGFAEFYVYNTRDERYRLDKELNGKYFVWDTKSKDYPFDKTRNRHYFFGKVVFKFRCYKVEEIGMWNLSEYGTKTLMEESLCIYSCLDHFELKNYIKDKPSTAIHISDLEIFDKPKELSEFKKYNDIDLHNHICLNCPHHYFDESGTPIESCCDLKWRCDRNYLTKSPQSFCYIESEE